MTAMPSVVPMPRTQTMRPSATAARRLSPGSLRAAVPALAPSSVASRRPAHTRALMAMMLLRTGAHAAARNRCRALSTADHTAMSP